MSVFFKSRFFSSLRFKWIGIVILAILTLPIFGMIFTKEVHWTLGDFVLAAVLLIFSLMLIEYAAKRLTSNVMRLFVFSIIILGLIFIWTLLATEII